jgi:murein DD-endopeptidase MepM/ murein hydrolase activator NlpD
MPSEPQRIDDRINRRRFLEYAIGIGAAVGYTTADAYFGWTSYGKFIRSLFSSNHGINDETTTSTSKTTIESSSLTSTASSATSAKLASLNGRLFFDYNGNGMQDGEEPAVSDAKVSLKDNTGKLIAEAVTDSAGDYKLEDIPTGSYGLYVEADEKFRYTCTSEKEFRAIEKGYQVLLEESEKLSIGLMEGYETLPLLSKSSITIRNFVDVGDVENPNDPVLRDWQGGTHTYKGHQGIDYIESEGTEVVATAPGVIIGAENNWQTNPDLHEIGNRVVIDHLNGFKTAYNHLKDIKVQEKALDLRPTDVSSLQQVSRGEVIATVGKTGETPFSHLHFEAWPPTYRYFGGGKGWVIDHYRDLYFGKHSRALFSNSVSLWTVNNNPQ